MQSSSLGTYARQGGALVGAAWAIATTIAPPPLDQNLFDPGISRVPESPDQRAIDTGNDALGLSASYDPETNLMEYKFFPKGSRSQFPSSVTGAHMTGSKLGQDIVVAHGVMSEDRTAITLSVTCNDDLFGRPTLVVDGIGGAELFSMTVRNLEGTDHSKRCYVRQPGPDAITQGIF